MLLDQDGPLAAWDRHFWNLCVAEGIEFDIADPDLSAHRYITEHIPNPDHLERAKALHRSPGFYADIPVVPGAQEGVEALLDYNINVWICTKPSFWNSQCESGKRAWIFEHFPALSQRFHISLHKGMVFGDVLLDDAHVREWIDVARWSPVVYRTRYNRSGTEWADLPAFDWSEPIERLVSFVDRMRGMRS